MNNSILIVPVQVDALFVPSERMVVEETADFSRLPFTTPEVDVNPNNPYISEEIVSKPFQNTNLLLRKGIHLHWTLPDALTREKAEKDDAETRKFPSVPNRWLIRKFKKEKVDEEWVVLSDYLHPAGAGEGNVCIPYPPDPKNGKYQPFRFLGRAVPLDEYQDDLLKGKSYPSYPHLTVLGYGEPTFAAFYPNCHSVFGFHDPLEIDDPSTTDLNNLSYEVIGWYSDENKDFLKIKIEEFQKRFAREKEAEIEKLTRRLKEEEKTLNEKEKQHLLNKKNKIRTKPKPVEILDYIKETLKWRPTDQNNSVPEVPKEMICYSRIHFEPATPIGKFNKGLEYADATVAVGITGTEALSAYLGHSLSSDKGAENKEKRMIENQMEALLIGSDNGGQLDIGSRFMQLRHEKGFIAEEGGHSWIIQKEGDQIIDEHKLDTTWSDYPSLQATVKELNNSWDAIRDLLSEVNKDHLEYDNATFEIEAKKEQLFADWYKYMVCAYPPENAWDSTLDMDDVKYFIEGAGLNPLKEQKNKVGILQIDINPISASTKIKNSQAENLAKKINTLSGKLNAHNSLLSDIVSRINENIIKEQEKELKKQEEIKAPVFILFQKPRPRFWKPKDPVVLAVGPALEASTRYGRDGKNDPMGRLSCAIFKDGQTVNEIIKDKRSHVFGTLIADIPFALNTWKDQPWNPLMLEWRVQLLPVLNKANMAQDTMDFDPSFIKNNFVMRENDPDVSYLPNGEVHVPSASVYSGSSILTPNAGRHLTETLKAYIEKNILRECLVNETGGKGLFDDNPDNKKSVEDFLNVVKNVDYTLDWYRKKRNTTEPEFKDLSLTAIRAYQMLIGGNFHSLSQALGGFNESLLMRKETLQLKIRDPLAFPEYGKFTKDVADAVGTSSSRRAPLPQNDFNPLRAGTLSITDLRVVDSFGQYMDLDIKTLMTSEYLEAPDNDQQVLLRPRFLQAAQVHFRWLAAQAQTPGAESDEMMVNNPICGWVMSNNLDNSLMIFNASGEALGGLTETDHDWKPAPGTNDTFQLDSSLEKWVETPPEGINPHLYKMLLFIRDRMKEDDTFLTDFRLAINSALDNIHPDTFAQHNSLAQLMGRPIALVRASLDLVLKAPPAIHQGWTVFQLDMNSYSKRETNEFTKVQFPIRIGEHDQLNDGVVGYWVESKEDENFVENKFYSPSANVLESRSRYIVTHVHNEGELNDDSHEGHVPVNQFQTLDDHTMTVSLLFDPRGKVNLTTGLLPGKTLDISPKLYMEAMDRMEVFFVSSPHIVHDSPQEQDHPFPLRLDLPKAPGYEWSFVRKKAEWVEEPVLPGLLAENLFSGEKKIKEGWLKLRKSNK